MSEPNPATPQATTGWLARLGRLKRPLVAMAGVGAVLSGLAGWWNTYQTVRVATGTSAVPSPAEITALSVMVLPFANQTGDAQKAYIADALTSSITADLSRIRDAFIVPTATAFAYRDKPMPVQQLGKAAGVRYVLTGSVLAGGEKLRISAQLADTSTGAQIWSRSFDGELADLMGLQDQVTTLVADGIGDSMVVNAARQSEKRRGNTTAADLRLQARAVNLQPQSRENFDRMEALLRQALALEPGNAPTELQLAETLSRRASNFDRGPERQADRQRRMVEARMLAEKAAKSEPDDPLAYRILGRFAEERRDVAEARRAYERRLALEPKLVGALSDLAGTYMYDGADGARRGLALMEQAAALEANRPNGATQMNLGEARFAAGDSARAVDNLRTALQLNPNLAESYIYLAMAYAELGDADHLREMQARFQEWLSKQVPAGAPTSLFETFEQGNSVDTPGYRAYRDTRVLPLWRKAGLPP